MALPVPPICCPIHPCYGAAAPSWSYPAPQLEVSGDSGHSSTWLTWGFFSRTSLPPVIFFTPKKKTKNTLQGTNISPFKGTFESMIFLFPRWDMLIPFSHQKKMLYTPGRFNGWKNPTAIITHVKYKENDRFTKPPMRTCFQPLIFRGVQLGDVNLPLLEMLFTNTKRREISPVYKHTKKSSQENPIQLFTPQTKKNILERWSL